MKCWLWALDLVQEGAKVHIRAFLKPEFGVLGTTGRSQPTCMRGCGSLWGAGPSFTLQSQLDISPYLSYLFYLVIISFIFPFISFYISFYWRIVDLQYILILVIQRLNTFYTFCKVYFILIVKVYLYSIYTYCKSSLYFPVLYNITCSLLTLYRAAWISLSHSPFLPHFLSPLITMSLFPISESVFGIHSPLFSRFQI